ncbi:MAG: AmmeMemoRadiSam system protein B [Fidelibacterota bacterium]|nr:MAG: AmmeMemoRadiSam system protein B [Candidatus Neomarinimicrobiota bacterium]
MTRSNKTAASGPIRRPAARGFYPGDCQAQMKAFLAGYHPPKDLPRSLGGAALPHAGWMYSGQVAARTLSCFSRNSPEPETVVIFGTPHYAAALDHALYPGSEWETPMGNLTVDSACGEAILEAAGDLLRADARAHRHEHSIEVLMPMVKYFFPETAIVPILAFPETSAVALGNSAAGAVIRLERSAIFLASSDLTHYGPTFGLIPAGKGPEAKVWMENNDQRLIDSLYRGTGEEVLHEARTHLNACGAGALAALKGVMTVLGAPEGRLIEYATSFDAEPEPVFRQAVGYAGVVF